MSDAEAEPPEDQVQELERDSKKNKADRVAELEQAILEVRKHNQVIERIAEEQRKFIIEHDIDSLLQDILDVEH